MDTHRFKRILHKVTKVSRIKVNSVNKSGKKKTCIASERAIFFFLMFLSFSKRVISSSRELD